MNIVHLTQGTPEWHAHRLQHFNASDAPAMMGCSPYKTRAALIRELSTGLAADVDANTQRLFDAGHRFEALARPLAEQIIGEELSPVVGTRGKLSASFDGITFMGDVIFEHKTLNDSLRYTPWDEGNGDHLPAHFRVQMEHQLHVSGAERCLFMATKWTGDECTERRHCWYVSDAALRAQILAGWEQLEKDVATYQPEPAAAPAPVGRAPESLPALRIEVTGAVTASNLAEFKQTALDAIRSVNRDLKTDTDFADAEKAVKWCADVESRLKAAKEHALSQTADIDALFKALDDISAEARTVRLDLDKLVKRRKDEVKEEAVRAARAALTQHIVGLEAELAPIKLQLPAVDFAAAIKGLRSISSMQDALDNELANGKIAADAQARVIRANNAAMVAADACHLFVDFQHVCTKPADDFANLIASRKAEEAERLERQQREEAERQAAELQESRRRAEDADARATQQAALAAAPAPEVVAIRPAPAVNEAATMSLGAINQRLGFTVSADFLASLGFEAHKERAARLYRPSDFPAICAGISAHVLAVAAEKQAA